MCVSSCTPQATVTSIKRNFPLLSFDTNKWIGQGEYEEACRLVFKTLGELDNRLKNSRYLVTSYQNGWASPQPTLADWHLLPVLTRFDAVYYPLFKANLHYLSHYPHLQVSQHPQPTHLEPMLERQQLLLLHSFSSVRSPVSKSFRPSPQMNAHDPDAPYIQSFQTPHCEIWTAKAHFMLRL